MAHLHEMRDTDSHFTIDPLNRVISPGVPGKSILIQYDHNSEIFTFEMPRYVDGHDMTICNRVEVHYINTDSNTRQNNLGTLEIEDFKISEDDENIIVWSWTISNNATQLVGTLSFAFRFACLNDTLVEYAWSTAPYTSIVVSKGIYNGELLIEEYNDLLEQWERKLGVGIESVEQEVESTDPNGVNVVTLNLTDGTSGSFNVRNGVTPIRGVDYWTDEDQASIVNDVLSHFSIAEEASF